MVARATRSIRPAIAIVVVSVFWAASLWASSPAPDVERFRYSGASVRIIERDVKSWRKNYQNINVDVELLKISKECESGAFLDDKNYFFQLSGLLQKRNMEAGNRKNVAPK